jgi:RNA polymerase sigma factor (sigma-70 family)
MAEDPIIGIRGTLVSFAGITSLKTLFWTHLSYDRVRDPLSPAFLLPTVRKAVATLEVFAGSQARTIVYVTLKERLDGGHLEQMAWAIERKLPNCVVVLFDSAHWFVILLDEATKPRVRMLALPGPVSEREQTARALSALNAADDLSGAELDTFKVSEKLDTFFPGVMPHLGDLLEEFSRYETHKDPEVRDLLPFVREVGRYPLLTSAQERGEDITGRERTPDGCSLTYQEWRLTVHNLRLVLWLARKSPRMGMSLSDLVQEGCLGLMTAAKRYKPELGNRFTTYAFHWVRQSMHRGLHNQCNLIRWPVWRAVSLIPAARNGEEEGLGAGEKPVRFVPWNCTMISLYGQDDPIELLSRKELHAAIEEALSSLEPREQDVIRRRYGLGGEEEETLESVGQRYKLTRERIRQIEKKAFEKLQGYLSFRLIAHAGAMTDRISGARDYANISSFYPLHDFMQGLHTTRTEGE